MRITLVLIAILTACLQPSLVVAQSEKGAPSTSSASIVLNTVEFHRAYTGKGETVGGRKLTEVYVAKTEILPLLSALGIKTSEFGTLAEAATKALRAFYNIPPGQEFNLTMYDTPEQVMFRETLDAIQHVAGSWAAWLDKNPDAEKSLITKYKNSKEFSFDTRLEPNSAIGTDCFDVSNVASTQIIMGRPTVVMCLSNMRYASSLFRTIAIAPLVERQYLPEGITPVIKYYNKRMREVQSSRGAASGQPDPPCDLITYLYVTFEKKSQTLCMDPLPKLQANAAVWFSSPGGTWVLDVPFLFNARARGEYPAVTLAHRAAGIENSFINFVFLHEIGHIMNNDFENGALGQEQRADRFAFDVIMNADDLDVARFYIGPALQAYFAHLRSSIVLPGIRSDNARDVIDLRYKEAYLQYVKAEQLSLERAQRAVGEEKQFEYRLDEFCWSMRLPKGCQPKDALKRGIPPLPG